MQVMVIFVLGLVGISAWAVILDILYPAFVAGSGLHRLLLFILASVYMFLVCLFRFSCSFH